MFNMDDLKNWNIFYWSAVDPKIYIQEISAKSMSAALIMFWDKPDIKEIKPTVLTVIKEKNKN